MKHITFLLLTMAVSNVSFGQKKMVLKGDEIPAPILQFSTQYLNENTLLKVVKETNGDDVEYEVKYSNKIEVEFDQHFRLKEVEAKKGVPAILIPKPILDYLRINQSGDIVKELDFNEDGTYKVSLDRELELLFDKDFNLIK